MLNALPPQIVMVGSLHMDVVVNTALRPRPGETLAGQSWRLQFGGKGVNQALQAATQGARVALIGRVGADQFGVGLVETLCAARIDTQYVRVDKSAGSGMSVALIDDQGIPGSVIVSGVNLHIGAEDVAAAETAIRGATCLLLQHEIPAAANLAAAQLAHAHSVRVILSAAPAYPLDPPLIAYLDVLVVNEVEAAMLSGQPVHNAVTAERAAQALLAHVPAVLITLGRAGVVVHQRGAAAQHIPGYQVTVADTLGAGDAFTGGLAARLAAGDALLAAAQYANATGALAVTQPGTTGEHLRPERVRALMGH